MMSKASRKFGFWFHFCHCDKTLWLKAAERKKGFICLRRSGYSPSSRAVRAGPQSGTWRLACLQLHRALPLTMEPTARRAQWKPQKNVAWGSWASLYSASFLLLSRVTCLVMVLSTWAGPSHVNQQSRNPLHRHAQDPRDLANSSFETLHSDVKLIVLTKTTLSRLGWLRYEDTLSSLSRNKYLLI